MKARFTIFICLIVLAAVLSFNGMFHGCTRSEKSQNHQEQIKNHEQQLHALDSAYKAQLHDLQYRCDSFEFALSVTKLKLKAANQQLDSKKEKVISLARKDTTGKSVHEIITDCDSLKAEALLFASEVDTVRALYEQKKYQLEQLVIVKDSLIETCHESYLDLKALSDEQLQHQHQMANELQESLTNYQRKSRRTKLAAVGVALSTVVAGVIYLTTHAH